MRLAKFECIQIVARMSLPLAVWCIPLSTFGQTITPATEQPPSATAEQPAEAAATSASRKDTTTPLHSVIQQVTEALHNYQKSLGSGQDALPPLDSAEFDFKATTDVTAGVAVNFLIFKFGGSHQNEAVNDVVFTYSMPPPPNKAAGNNKPTTLTEALGSTIQSAAAAVKTDKTMGKLKLNKLAVTIQFGVKWNGNGGIAVPVSFVTVGLNGELAKNTVQSVKLVFGK